MDIKHGAKNGDSLARGILTEGHLISVRLPSQCHQEARNIPPHRQSRFLASRGLLAELMFMLYGIGELPEIVTLPKGKPVFSDKICLRFLFPMPGIWSAWR